MCPAHRWADAVLVTGTTRTHHDDPAVKTAERTANRSERPDGEAAKSLPVPRRLPSGLARTGFRPAAWNAGRVVGLDGLRTLALGLVLVYHVEPDLLPGGSVAVDLFFTISGFVITRLLMAEYARTGDIAMARFYRRRWLRLVPALLVVCAFTAVMGTVTSLPGFDDGTTAAGLAAAFLVNVVRAVQPGPYDEATAALGHTWSLGVEEQFYLAWPLLLRGVLRGMSARAAVLCVAGICFLPLLWRCVLWDPDAAHRLYNGTDTRADQLLAGAVLAVVLGRLAPADRRRELLRVWAGRLCWPAIVVLGLIVGRMPITGDDGIWTSLWYTIGLSGTALLSAIVIAALQLRPTGLLSRLLSAAPLVWIGRNLSYGMYLWHYPMVRLLAGLGVDAWRLPATVAATLLVATASHYLVERPLHRRRGAAPVPAPDPACASAAR